MSQVGPSPIGATQEVTPRRLWYVIPIAIFVLGGIASVLLVVEGVQGLGEELERVIAPGVGSVDFDETGRWHVFYEYRSTFEGRVVTAPYESPPIRVTINSPTGAQYTGNPTGRGLNYSLPSAAGYSIAYVDVAEPGRYSVVVESTDPNMQEAVVAFGHEKPRSIGRLFGGIALGSATFFGVLLSFGLILFFRVRSKRRLREQLAYGMPPPPPGAMPPGPPPSV